MHCRTSRVVVALAVAAAVLGVPLRTTAQTRPVVDAAAAHAPARAWVTPRTPDGQPDLQGIWDYRTVTPLERPPQFKDKAFLTDEEVADKAKLPLHQVKEIREAPRIVTSLDKKIGDDGDGAELGELFAMQAPGPDEDADASMRAQAVRRVLSELPDRERAVIELRYGLNNDGTPTSLEEIGRRLGITRERVRQIERDALMKLQASDLADLANSA